MTAAQHPDFVFYLLALILPLSALLTRRIPLKQALVMAGAWIGIFLVGVLIVGASRNMTGSSAWASFTALLSDDEQHVTDSAIRLRMAPDGHFWATVSIDGVPRRMLIDSGATTTSLNLDTAQAAGLDLAQNPIAVPISTANGLVMAQTSSVRRLVLGPIAATDLRVVVAREFGDTNVLGMNFLSRLKSWRVDGQTLVLEPKTP